MKLFQTSIIELVCWPLKWFGTPRLREQYVYEHAIGPVIVAEILRHLPSPWQWIGFGVLAFVHLAIKELIVDRLDHGEFNWPNVWERSYGLILAALVIIIK